MPYIDKEKAQAIDNGIKVDANPGELNYHLSSVLADYIDYHGLSYTTLNDISGAMTECLAEFRRRVVVPYEKVKYDDGGADPYDKCAPMTIKPYDFEKEWVERNKEGLA